MFVLGTIWFYFVVKMGRNVMTVSWALFTKQKEKNPYTAPPHNDATGLYKSNVITLLLKNMRKL